MKKGREDGKKERSFICQWYYYRKIELRAFFEKKIVAYPRFFLFLFLLLFLFLFSL